MTGDSETRAGEGWALRAAAEILGSLEGNQGFPLARDDWERARLVLARLMVRERLLGLSRHPAGAAWIYRLADPEAACPECGLAYADHPADPAAPGLTLACSEGRVRVRPGGPGL